MAVDFRDVLPSGPVTRRGLCEALDQIPGIWLWECAETDQTAFVSRAAITCGTVVYGVEHDEVSGWDVVIAVERENRPPTVVMTWVLRELERQP